MPSLRAISLLVLPEAINRAISFCLSVRESRENEESGLFFFASHATGQFDHTGSTAFPDQTGAMLFDRVDTDT